MTMDVTFYGATATVTGSKTLVEVAGKRLLVDCGLFQGYKTLRDRNWAPLPFDPASLDAVLLTHAHIDHSGSLPLLMRGGFKGRIWTTSATAELAAILLQPDLVVNWPEKGRFRITGGLQVTPEFTALLVGLGLSASAGIAEIVRAGILSVGRGQWEASRSVGLRDGQTMRLVVLPQALRVIVPPLTSSYLSTFKNSSLAIAIGYPDLVMVSNTTMNQTGQAIEGIAIFMLVYLGMSITISLFMNWYNARVALVER